MPTNLAPAEVLEGQLQVFYFSGNKPQHTEEEGDSFINLTGEAYKRLLNDFYNGITLAMIDNNSLYASIPEETQPFDLAVAICNLVGFCNQSNLSPPQILKAARHLDYSLKSLCFDTRRRGIFKREYSFNKKTFNKFQKDILDQAHNVLNGVKTGV